MRGRDRGGFAHSASIYVEDEKERKKEKSEN